VVPVIFASYTDATRDALDQLRDTAGFEWTIVFLLILVSYIYAQEVERGRFEIVAAGLALWFADWINELLNSAILHISGTAPLWVETGPTSYQILVGLNIETSFLFLFYGIVYAKMLPADREARMLGMNNRLALAIALSIVSVGTEVILNAGFDVLHWHWWWWDIPWGLPLIVIFGYVWFFLIAARAHDADEPAVRWRIVGTLAATAGALALAFGIAGWL
jgi:hypothetical protein